MLSLTVLCAAILLGVLCNAQNPYALKRPPYCSTCFTNSQSENYYCCFYFFRCCAESRLGSNNRKASTPGPNYPDIQTEDSPKDGQKYDVTEKPTQDESQCEKSVTSKPGLDHTRERGELDADWNKHKVSTLPSAIGSKTSSPQAEDASQLQPSVFRVPSADVIPIIPGYSSEVSRKTHQYGNRRVYPSWQSTGTTSAVGKSEILREQHSPQAKTVESGKRDEKDGEVIWGRMEPFKTT